MRVLVQLFILMIPLLLFTSCSQEKYPKIQEDISLAITINLKDTTLSFIDLDKKIKIADWKMNKPYTGAIILPDNDSILLFGKQVESADLYSLKMGKLINSWKTGKGIVNGKLLQSNKEITLVDQRLNKIRFFDLNGNEKESVQTEQNPLTIIEAKKSHKLYVLSFNKQQLIVIDLKTKDKATGFQIHPSAAGALVNEKEKEIWIGGHGAGAEIEKNIHVYDLETGKLKYTIPAPFMPVNFLCKDGSAFVLSHGSSKLYKLDSKGNILDSVIVGSNPFEMVLTGDSLLITGYDSNDVHLLNPNNLKIIKTIPVGNGPFQIVLRGRENDEKDKHPNY